MNITGNNYYGILYVPESASYNNVITEYKNITYVSPQISLIQMVLQGLLMSM